MPCPDADCGKIRRWVDGCRLPPCDATATDLRQRFHAAEAVARLPVDLPAGVEHGDPSGDRAYGCGCDPCRRTMNAVSAAKRRARRIYAQREGGGG